ncbi:hypothetical protein AVEN_128014-1 [Araneus ventricosus]|uniref:RRM domain-containing protein n=1 Tax=Araneus ventricosus TaxID=182803 RepID=A0A4Y2A093_ARAVE|nr:hypothetical protein AVEN_128014-1 [Araneus ventricosus]
MQVLLTANTTNDKCYKPLSDSLEMGLSALGGQPDQDSIKMFVGQIPRHWNERDLTKIFEEFGPVYQISVLRDKISQQSRDIQSLRTSLLYYRKIICTSLSQVHLGLKLFTVRNCCHNLLSTTSFFSMKASCEAYKSVLSDHTLCLPHDS